MMLTNMGYKRDRFSMNYGIVWVIILSCIPHLMVAKTYYVKPTLKGSCPEDPGVSCMTLSEYAEKPSSYFASNVTLIVLPGKHILHEQLSLTDLSHVAIVSNTTNNTPQVSCLKNGRFSLKDVENVSISGLKAVGCAQNEFVSLKTFTIQKFILTDIQGDNGNGFVVVGVINMFVRDTYFANIDITTYSGGAMYILNSSVSISNSTFHKILISVSAADQFDAVGGVFYIEHSTLVARQTTFANNSVSDAGGVIYSDTSTILLLNCTMSNNNAGEGGVIYAIDTNVTINNSNIHHNTAERHSVLFVTSTEISNLKVIVHIHDCNVHSNEEEFRGMLYADTSVDFIITSSDFHENQVGNGSIVVVIGSLTSVAKITTLHCTFTNNEASDGGVIVAVTNVLITTNASTFVSNNLNGRVLSAIIFCLQKCAVNIYSSIFDRNVIPQFGVLTLKKTTATIHDSFFRFNSGKNVIGIVNSSYTTISSSTFLGNEVTGGVIHAQHYSVINVETTTFDNNVVHFYGVLKVLKYSRVTIHRSHFSFNMAQGKGGTGGVLLLMGASYATITFSHFKGNRANYSSGVAYALDASTLRISNCTFVENIAQVCGVLQAVNNASVTINDSQFRNNRVEGNGGVLCTVNCSMVAIENTEFINNTANRAGVMVCTSNSSLAITKSLFTDNFASTRGGVLFIGDRCTTVITYCAFSDNSAFTGGVVDNQDSSITIDNSMFLHNTATGLSGVLICYTSFTESAELNLVNVSFIRNSANIAGGAMTLYGCRMNSRGSLNITQNNSIGVVYLIQSTVMFLGTMVFSHNFGSFYAFDSKVNFNGTATFVNNTSHTADDNSAYSVQLYQEGGALSSFESDLNFNGNTSFADNYGDIGGAILSVESNVFTNGITVFIKNKAMYGGALYTYQSSINFAGNCTILENTGSTNGGGVCAISSTLKFIHGSHMIIGNSAKGGGGIYLERDSKLYVKKVVREIYRCEDSACFSNEAYFTQEWLELHFIQNLADYGGGIYVKDGASSDTCKSMPSTMYSPTNECFFQTLAVYWNPKTTQNVHKNNTFFKNNSATIRGDTLYGGLLDRCTVSPYAEHFIFSFTLHTPVRYLQSVTNIELKSISSDPVRICFCKSNEQRCNYLPPTINVMKGQTFSVSVVAVDQVNNSVPALVHSTLSSQSGALGEGESKQNTTERCTELKYTVLTPHSFEQVILYPEGPCKDIGISKNMVQVTFLPCPVGFALSKSKSSCECDPVLKPYITNCSIATSSLLRKDDFWIDYVNKSLTESGFIVYPHCPFDYCEPSTKNIYINLNVPNGSDSQCSYNRSQKLCGKCKPGFSQTFGTTRCKICSNYWLLLIFPLALAGIVLVTVILMLNLTVAVGTINSFVFYANVIAANNELFFTTEHPDILTVFIAWLNLDLGFETCFYDGMDAYIKTWLQFVFPLYIIFLVAAIIIIGDYSIKFAGLFVGKNPVATLATLILLSYAKLLRTIIAALSFAQLQHPDGSKEIVWLLDANVPYLTGKHIPLFITATLTAALGLGFAVALFSWQWFVMISCFRKVKCFKWTTNSKFLSFIDAYHAPYNKHHRYWIGLTFLLRTLLYLVSAVNVLGDPRVNLVSICCVMIFLISLQALFLKKPHKNILCNTWELTSYFNLAILAALSFYFRDSHGNQAALTYTSTSITFTMFSLVIVYHMYTFICKRYLRTRDIAGTLKMLYRLQNNNTTNEAIELPNTIASGEEPTVTEVDGLPTINATTDSENETSDTDDSSDCDETAPLLKANTV